MWKRFVTGPNLKLGATFHHHRPPAVPSLNPADGAEMSSSKSRAEYVGRMHRVLQHIDTHRCSPTSWRLQQSTWRAANSNPSQMNRNTGQAPERHLGKNEDVLSLTPEVPMKVELVDRQPATIAYLRHVGPYGVPIAQFWQKTVYPWMLTSGLLQRPRYGISHDDPTITAPQQCRYDAGCEVSPASILVGGAQRTIIPGGRYAALSFKGTVADVQEAWIAMLRDWLPSSGLQLDGRVMFEYYPEDSSYDPTTGVFDCKLCIPVTPL